MPYTKFTTAQIYYLRQHYAEQSPGHFAQQWGVGIKQVYALAQRYSIKRRAPNGQPLWRGKANHAGLSPSDSLLSLVPPKLAET